MTQVVMLADRVWEAVAAVTDPEYPDLTIVDLGILERIEVDAEGRAEIGLVPTALGCPALAQIRSDVGAAAQAAGAVTVGWCRRRWGVPPWPRSARTWAQPLRLPAR
jgi:ring-1,2-phenylacetyl-CoA epoxidase subunit PaaD